MKKATGQYTKRGRAECFLSQCTRNQSPVVDEMFRTGYNGLCDKIEDPTLKAEDIPKELCYFLNKRMLVTGLDMADHAGHSIKCAVCNVGVGVNPFERKFGQMFEHHPGPACTSPPFGHPGSIAR